MYLVFSGGVILWLVYGVLLNDMPIIIANALTLMLCLAVLMMKVRFK